MLFDFVDINNLPKDWNIKSQLKKIHEEVFETSEAILEKDHLAAIGELLDIMQTCNTALAMLGVYQAILDERTNIHNVKVAQKGLLGAVCANCAKWEHKKGQAEGYCLNLDQLKTRAYDDTCSSQQYADYEDIKNG